MEQDHEWIPVVLAAECPACDCCGEPVCPRCGDHYADCPCPGPHQDDLFYYRRQGGQLQAIPRDEEIEPGDEADMIPDDEREPDDQAELRPEDSYEGDEPDDEDGEPDDVFDRIDLSDWEES